MFTATACTFRSSRLVAEENAPNRIRPTCVQARPSCRPCGTKRELFFPRKTFSRQLFGINPRVPLFASGSVIGRFGFVNKSAAWFGMVALVITWLLSACASSPQEGVVREFAPTEAPLDSGAAHFSRPSFDPGSEGTSSAHSGGSSGSGGF